MKCFLYVCQNQKTSSVNNVQKSAIKSEDLMHASPTGSISPWHNKKKQKKKKMQNAKYCHRSRTNLKRGMTISNKIDEISLHNTSSCHRSMWATRREGTVNGELEFGIFLP